MSDEHVDVVEDHPSPTAVCDDAIPHVCDSQDDGAPFISGTTPFLRVCPDTLGRITEFSKHEPN